MKNKPIAAVQLPVSEVPVSEVLEIEKRKRKLHLLELIVKDAAKSVFETLRKQESEVCHA